MPRTPARYNLLIVFGITLMVVMGVSSIMPVLPLIAKEMQVPQESVSLILTAFTLPGIFLAPVAGVLADRYGRKKVLIPALLVFGLAGAACSLADNLHTLIALRFLQGMGAAPLGVLYTTLIGDLYSGSDRIRIMGYTAGVLGMGTAAFPALGGLLGELGWHCPFVLPALALPLCYAVLRHLHLPEHHTSQGFREYARATFGIISSTQAKSIFLVTLFTFCILYGPMITFFPMLADSRFSMPPSAIGGLYASSSLATALASSQLGKLNAWFSERTLLCFGHALYLVAMLLMPFIPEYWWLLLPVCTFGMAQGLNFPNLTTLLTGLAPQEQRAAVMAINGMVLRLAQTIAPLAFTPLFWLGGFSGVYAGGAALAVVMLCVTLFWMKPPATPLRQTARTDELSGL